MWMADHIWDIWATTGFPWILEWFPFTWIQNSPKCTYVQNLRCIPTTPCELFLTSSFIKVWWNIPSIAASSFNLPTACFSTSYSLLPNNTRELGKKNCSQRMYMFDLMVGLRNLHQHGTPWQKPHPHPMMFDYALRLQNGEKVKKRVSCVSSPDNTSFHVRFC